MLKTIAQTFGNLQRRVSGFFTKDPSSDKKPSTPKTEPTLREILESRAICLDITINDIPIRMVIDSGSHNSILCRSVWQALGEPALEPFRYRLISNGTRIGILGCFTATVRYNDRVLPNLPLVVFQQEPEGMPNLLGRLWFSPLNLDWNAIFYRPGRVGRGPFQNPPLLPVPSSYDSPSREFHIQMRLNGIEMTMMFDTGTTNSQIGQKEWKLLGTPALQQFAPLRIYNAANNLLQTIGQTLVTANYKGEERLVWLLVTDAESTAIVGTNWYNHFDFDFNQILYDLQFIN